MENNNNNTVEKSWDEVKGFGKVAPYLFVCLTLMVLILLKVYDNNGNGVKMEKGAELCTYELLATIKECDIETIAGEVPQYKYELNLTYTVEETDYDVWVSILQTESKYDVATGGKVALKVNPESPETFVATKFDNKLIHAEMRDKDNE